MSRKSEEGFFTIEALGALFILAIMIPIAGAVWQMGVKAIKNRSVADHFMVVEKAARQYAKQSATTLITQVTQTTGPTVSIAALKTANCLPARFADTNAWGQQYQIVARKDKNNALAMVIVTTGGRGDTAADPAFANITVPETAAMARAGFVPTSTVHSSNVLRGAYGAWETTLASIGISATPGHIGIISTLSADELAQDYLYRVAVPGSPELNAMQTALDMTNHSINNVQDLDFVPKAYAAGFCTSAADEGKTFLDAQNGLYVCRNGQSRLVADTGNSLSLQGAQVVGNAELVAKPQCPAGTNTHPEIFVAPSIASSDAVTPTMASLQAWAVNYDANNWQVQLRILTAKDEWIYPSAAYGRMVVMTTCARN